MRATISFEADVSKVNDIMRSLVLEESNALQEAMLALEKATADRIVEGILEALEHIHGVTSQLEQYRQMMVSFERARFETMIPQPANSQRDYNNVENMTQVQELTEKVKQFDSFLDRINEEEEDENPEPEEG